jgi:hypothetical protein
MCSWFVHDISLGCNESDLTTSQVVDLLDMANVVHSKAVLTVGLEVSAASVCMDQQVCGVGIY